MYIYINNRERDIHTQICMYIYICIHKYIYIYIYIYTHLCLYVYPHGPEHWIKYVICIMLYNVVLQCIIAC